MRWGRHAVIAMMATTATSAYAAPTELSRLRAELTAAREEIAQQRQQMEMQDKRLRALEERFGPGGEVATAAPNPSTGANTPPAPAIAAAQGSASSVPGDPAAAQHAPLERVGQAAPGSDRPPEVAVLGSEGSVVTRKHQLTAEYSAEYARADRNSAIFRGIAIVPQVFVGVINVTESRQDILTASGSLRYGLTDKLELGVRVPFVHRADNLATTPVAQPNQPETSQATKGTGIGDVEFSARYQIMSAHGGWPYLIGGLQVVAPTGTNPFKIDYSPTGEALKAATGAGFWGVSPSLTAILPSDPAVLFGTIGYTRNFGRNFSTDIAGNIIDRVVPGDGLSFSGGIGISLNQRTSINLGYAHTWAFGTKVYSHVIDPQSGAVTNFSQTSRDLQIGRFLFGMTYKVSDRASVNWSLELGSTEDATDMRTVLRIPLILLSGG